MLLDLIQLASCGQNMELFMNTTNINNNTNSGSPELLHLHQQLASHHLQQQQQHLQRHRHPTQPQQAAGAPSARKEPSNATLLHQAFGQSNQSNTDHLGQQYASLMNLSLKRAPAGYAKMSAQLGADLVSQQLGLHLQLHHQQQQQCKPLDLSVRSFASGATRQQATTPAAKRRHHRRPHRHAELDGTKTSLQIDAPMALCTSASPVSGSAAPSTCGYSPASLQECDAAQAAALELSVSSSVTPDSCQFAPNNNHNSNANLNHTHLSGSLGHPIGQPSGAKRAAKAKGAKLHLCAHCGRSFSRSDMLTRHARLHSGVKPYQCSKCKQVFSRSDHLSTHERTHTGEKPYQCEHCSYSACRRDMITRHMRTHANSTATSRRSRSPDDISD